MRRQTGAGKLYKISTDDANMRKYRKHRTQETERKKHHNCTAELCGPMLDVQTSILHCCCTLKSLSQKLTNIWSSMWLNSIIVSALYTHCYIQQNKYQHTKGDTATSTHYIHECYWNYWCVFSKIETISYILNGLVLKISEVGKINSKVFV